MSYDEIDFTDRQMLRKVAEEKLASTRKESGVPKTEIEIKKLLHELQVHQIELEMQNEELKQAYETSEIALKKYTMLYDLAAMGYFTLDSEGTICDLNFTAADMLGDRRFSLINKNFKLFIAEDSKLIFDDFFKKIYANGAKESCEVSLAYDNKPLCFVYIDGVITGDEQKCLLSVIEISWIKRHNEFLMGS